MMQKNKSALILVDLQNDFCFGGALAVPEGDDVIPIANKLMDIFDIVIATKDWHPKNHVSFAEVYQKKPGEVIVFNGISQILWPTHCVQNTEGSAFVKGWPIDKVDHIIYKGTDIAIDSYSAFFDNGRLKATNLHPLLQKNGISTLYVAGVATEYCVKYSVLDAIQLGYSVRVITDGCKAVNLSPEDESEALLIMKDAGAFLE